MPDYYYIDLYFDPEETPLSQIVDGCVGALMRSGATFEKVFMAQADSRKQISLGEHVSIKPAELGLLAEAYMEDVTAKEYFVSFPHLGRIMFRYDFTLDNAIIDEIREEEADTRSSAHDIGLSFIITSSKQTGKRVKASFSFWEEYILTHGSADVHRENMQKVIALVERIAKEARPFFGAMNSELHLNTDRSLDMLWAGKVPDGNDYVLVGKALMYLLDREMLERRGIKYRLLPESMSSIVQFTDEWD